MPDLSIMTMIEQLEAIRRELNNKSLIQTTGVFEGATWLRGRMLKRAADELNRAINELECYQRPDEDLDAWGQNLKILEENSH
jgi:hypothetical protein